MKKDKPNQNASPPSNEETVKQQVEEIIQLDTEICTILDDGKRNGDKNSATLPAAQKRIIRGVRKLQKLIPVVLKTCNNYGWTKLAKPIKKLNPDQLIASSFTASYATLIERGCLRQKVGDMLFEAFGIDEAEKKPDDLITLVVAMSNYVVSRPTLERHIQKGSIKSYRPKGSPTNAPHEISEKEVASRWPKRQK